MWLANLWRRSPKHTPTQPKRVRLAMERLETREVPASYTASTVPDLITAITAANQTAEADTITLAPGKTFTLTAANNADHGPTGLPTIAAGGGSLTIIGNSSVIERSKAVRTPPFRLFTVAVGASLTLEDLTVQNGHAVLWGNFTTVGGAIANFGTLSLKGVTVRNNVAGHNLPSEGLAVGGGIYSNGTLTVTDSTIRNNQVFGRWAYGAGIYVGGGTATFVSTTISFNEARGIAKTKEFPAGQGIGGGLFIENAGVYLDFFTASHVVSNKASTSHPNIYGSYVLLS